MNEAQALELQKWCYYNLKLSLVLKEQDESGWFVTIGTPNGERFRVGKEPFYMAVAFDPNTPSPHKARLGLIAPDNNECLCFKGGLGKTEVVALLNVHPSSLKGTTSPRVYVTHEDRPVLVF